MLDCPGVIFEKELTRNQLILQNTVKGDTNPQLTKQLVLHHNCEIFMSLVTDLE